MNASYIIEADGDGFIARIIGHDNLFAYGDTPEEAKQELRYVIDMMIDYQQEQLIEQKNIRNSFA